MRIYSVKWGSDNRELYVADSMRELFERILLEPEIPERFLQISLEGETK